MVKILKVSLDKYVGCLSGSTIGDALGAPVEFIDLNHIRAKYGKDMLFMGHAAKTVTMIPG